jgi:hypothetical protein
MANPTKEMRINYQHSLKGVLTLSYHKQVERSKKKGMHLPTYTVKELHARFLNDPKYLELFKQWEMNGFNIYDRPSIDRINPDLGYTMENIQIMTWRENRAKGDIENARRRSTAVVMLDLDGNEIAQFESIQQAASATKIDRTSISRCCRGIEQKVKGCTFRYRGDKFRDRRCRQVFIRGEAKDGESI